MVYSNSRRSGRIARALRVGLVLGLLFSGTAVSANTGGVLVITEIMYHPSEGGQSLEWIEIYNRQPAPLDLSGWFFSDGISFVFPAGTWLNGHAYLVVCADEDRVRDVYGITNTVGNWAQCSDGATGGCALSNGGEDIEISEESGVVASRVDYNDRGKWPSAADGTGHSLALVDVFTDPDEPESWAASGTLGGTPGRANDTDEGALPIRVNEALLNTTGDRWVELYNHGTEAIDLAGFHITDDRTALTKAALPAGTSIAAGGFLSFTDTELGLDFTPLAAQQEGDDDPPLRRFIALVNPAGDRVIDSYIFEPGVEGTSEARIPDGSLDVSDHAVPTRDAANRMDVETDIVINEIMYHTWNNDTNGEFVEIHNRGEDAIDLSGWRFTRGVNFDFPEGTTIAGGGYLVVAGNPEYIRDTYGLAEGVVLGPDPADAEAVDDFGRLRDDGESVILRDENGNVADRVRYHDGGEFPLWADGGGPSLELIDPFHPNEFGSSWDSSDDSEKSVVETISYQGRFLTGQPEFHMALAFRGITIIDDLRMFQRVVTFEPSTTFIDVGDDWRYFKGTQEPSEPRDAWRQLDFDDGAWLTGASPFGFGEDAIIGDTGTTLEDMRRRDGDGIPGYTSFYLRREFTVADPDSIDSLVLTLQFDDGYIAYLNGTQVASENMDDDAFDATAGRSTEKASREIDISEHKNVLQVGRNVLAIQVHNFSATSADCLMVPGIGDGRFVNTDSDNLIANGDFEEQIRRGLQAGSWLLEGTHRLSGRTEKEAIAGTGSLKIVAPAKGDNKVNRLEATLPALARNGDYTIEFKAKWIVGSPNLLTHGHNMAGAQFDYPKSHRLSVPLNNGTPGAMNSVTARQVAESGSTNLGPVIRDVIHDPVMPAANEAVTVRARVSDPDGVGAVTLHYWLEDNRGQPGRGSAQLVPMSDADDDGVYEASLPGQANRTRVVFFITASDGASRTARYPLDALSRTHPLSLDPDDPGPVDEDFLVYRHDVPARPRNPRWHSYRMWMTHSQEVEMQRQRQQSNFRYEGTFIFNDEKPYYRARTRFSGSPWARGGFGGSYRVYMPRDKPLHGSSYIKKFNMEDHQNGATSCYERLSHYLYRHNGGGTKVPYSYHWLVQWQMNDRINTGREHAQTPNRQFIDYWYPDDDDGHMFEVDDRFEISDAGTRQSSIDARWTYPPMRSGDGEDKENYRWFFNTRLNKGLDDFRPLIEGAKILDSRATPDAVFDDVVWDAFDVEEMLRVWAIRMNTDDWDTWGTNRGKNCFVYVADDGGDGWKLFPWDMELTYGNVGAFMPGPITAPYSTINTGKFPEVFRMINRPQIKRLYYGIMKEMVDRHFWSSFLAPYRARLQQVGMTNLQKMDPNNFIDQRRTRLAGVLRSATGPTLSLSITTNGGNPITTDSRQVRIEGRAPVEMRFVVPSVNSGDPSENGGVFEFSRTNPLGWGFDVELDAGTHTIEFFGFSSAGDLLGTVAIDVTVNLSGIVIESVDPDIATVGDLVTITGSGLVAGSRVWFDEFEATEVDDSGAPSTLVARVPSGVPEGMIDVVVQVGEAVSTPARIEIATPPPVFIRGDTNVDGRVNITDPVATLGHLFQAEPLDCRDAADANDDGFLNLTDAIYVLDFLFRRGEAPAAPFPSAGTDDEGDGLECEVGLTES